MVNGLSCVTIQCLENTILLHSTSIKQSSSPLYDKGKNLIEVQQVEKEKNEDAFLYVRSEQKAKEASMSNRFSVRFEEELGQLSIGLSKKGTTKKSQKVWERIGRIKERYPQASKFYTIDVQSKEDIATHVKWTRKYSDVKSTDGVYFFIF